MSLIQVPWLDEFIAPTARLLITIGALFLAAFVLYRSKTSHFWKDERDAAIARAERFGKEKGELKTERDNLEKELIELKAKTDVSLLQSELSQAISLNQTEHKEITHNLKEIHKALIEITRILMRDTDDKK